MLSNHLVGLQLSSQDIKGQLLNTQAETTPSWPL